LLVVNDVLVHPSSQGTTDKQLPPDASLEQNFDLLSPDDKKAEMIKVLETRPICSIGCLCCTTAHRAK
jgi:hypothetical protein